MAVDYRLLHHFRISQRRELAARGESPTRIQGAAAPFVVSVDEPELENERTTTLPPTPGSTQPPSARPRPARIQVLTHLLNEDR